MDKIALVRRAIKIEECIKALQRGLEGKSKPLFGVLGVPTDITYPISWAQQGDGTYHMVGDYNPPTRWISAFDHSTLLCTLSKFTGIFSEESRTGLRSFTYGFHSFAEDTGTENYINIYAELMLADGQVIYGPTWADFYCDCQGDARDREVTWHNISADLPKSTLFRVHPGEGNWVNCG